MSTNYIDELNESQIRNILSNYEKEEFATISKCLIVLRNKYSTSIGSGVLENITKHFGKSYPAELYLSSDIGNQTIPTNANLNYVQKTEDKFDNDIIPTTKLVGMISSGLIGLLMIFNGSWLVGLLYAAGGIMATLGLCILLEGISTIIKLLRKISEK